MKLIEYIAKDKIYFIKESDLDQNLLLDRVLKKAGREDICSNIRSGLLVIDASTNNMGMGVSIYELNCEYAETVQILIAALEIPLKCRALDESDIKIAFTFISNKSSSVEKQKLISNLIFFLKTTNLRYRLMAAKNEEEFFSIFEEYLGVHKNGEN